MLLICDRNLKFLIILLLKLFTTFFLDYAVIFPYIWKNYQESPKLTITFNFWLIELLDKTFGQSLQPQNVSPEIKKAK